MPDVVHTADVHLAQGHPEREAALAAVLDVAEEAGASVVTIGGDLFHEPHDVDAIRPTLRTDLFANRTVEIVVIPGNHDREGFRGDTYFGDSCTPLLDEPFEHHIPAGLNCRITGVPFIDRPDDDLFVALADREPFDGPELLLVHCTLDIGFAGTSTGDEAERHYFPVTPHQLDELGFDYVLAGHFHQPRRESLESGVFAYPGTPASTTRTETGPRAAVAVDLDAQALGFETLATHHIEETRLEVLPGGEDALFDEVEAWVESAVREETEARIVVDGFHELDEEAFSERLHTAAGPAEVTDRTVTAGRLRSHALYQTFEDRLEETEWDDEVVDAVRLRTLEAFNRVRGEL